MPYSDQNAREIEELKRENEKLSEQLSSVKESHVKLRHKIEIFKYVGIGVLLFLTGVVSHESLYNIKKRVVTHYETSTKSAFNELVKETKDEAKREIEKLRTETESDFASLKLKAKEQFTKLASAITESERELGKFKAGFQQLWNQTQSEFLTFRNHSEALLLNAVQDHDAIKEKRETIEQQTHSFIQMGTASCNRYGWQAKQGWTTMCTVKVNLEKPISYEYNVLLSFSLLDHNAQSEGKSSIRARVVGRNEDGFSVVFQAAKKSLIDNAEVSWVTIPTSLSH